MHQTISEYILLTFISRQKLNIIANSDLLSKHTKVFLI